MWNKMQYEGSMAIANQARRGEISDKVAQVRGLMNDAMAHKAYQRIAAQAEQDRFRYNMIKNQYPDVLGK